MPVFDYQCNSCEAIDERFASPEEKVLVCNICGGVSRRVYLKLSTTHDTPNWLNDTVKVVDKNGAAHCQDFIKNPNRSNYKKWMKGEGLRPMEHGESTKVGLSSSEKNKKRADIRHKVKTSFRSREAISI